jgi:phage tail-like protein
MAFELELPAVYLDPVLLDPTPARPALLNRDPEPDDLAVPISTTVCVDITDVGPDGIDLAAARVYVGGQLAFEAGTFQPGFDGTLSAYSNPQPDTLRIVVQPIAPFASLQQVIVRVVAQTVGGAFALDQSWAFQCEDLTAPRVVGAQARELKRVRVSFDEPVKQEEPAAGDDALNPTLYALTRTSAPAVGAQAVAVEPVSGSSVDVLTDVELTPGASYRLTVTGVVDVPGNPVAPPDNVADFRGFVPAQPARRRLDLYQLLPAMNRREDETGDLRRFLLCLQEVTGLLLADVDGFTDILDPDVARESFVDLMLVDLGNPFPFDLSLVDKRRLLNVLVGMFREKGTAVGIKNAIRFFLGLEVVVGEYMGEALVLGESLLGEDWVLGPSGDFSPYAFELVAPRALAAEERRRIRGIVDYMKPAHTHLVRITEPEIPEVIDHLELGLSELGETWVLH